MKQMWFYVDAVGSGFGWINLAAAVLPFVFIRHVCPPERRWLLASVAPLLCLGPLLIAVLNPTPDRGSWEMLGATISLSFVVLAIWTGAGLTLLGRWFLVRSRLH